MVDFQTTIINSKTKRMPTKRKTSRRKMNKDIKISNAGSVKNFDIHKLTAEPGKHKTSLLLGEKKR